MSNIFVGGDSFFSSSSFCIHSMATDDEYSLLMGAL